MEQLKDAAWKAQTAFCKEHYDRCQLPKDSAAKARQENYVQATTGLIKVTTPEGLNIRLTASALANTNTTVHPMAVEAAQAAARGSYPSLDQANRAFNHHLSKVLTGARTERLNTNERQARAKASCPAEMRSILMALNNADFRAEQAGRPTYHQAGPVHASHTLFFAHDHRGMPLIRAAQSSNSSDPRRNRD
jgi:hypothetical protein